MNGDAYWTCTNCTHVFAHPAHEDPRECENCGSEMLEGFGDISEAEERSHELLMTRNHVGHFSIWGSWYCDTCESPYCILA